MVSCFRYVDVRPLLGLIEATDIVWIRGFLSHRTQDRGFGSQVGSIASGLRLSGRTPPLLLAISGAESREGPAETPKKNHRNRREIPDRGTLTRPLLR